MSAVKYALDRLSLEIPSEILNLAFMRKATVYSIPTTLEKQITDLVIEPIVLKDCNLIGGIELTIPVNGCNVTYYEHAMNQRNLVISVPYELTNNKKVLNALSLTANVTYTNMTNTSGNPLINSANNVMYHMGSVGSSTVITNLELIAPNVILVHDNVMAIANGFLRIIVENNSNLSNLQPSSYIAFSELVTYAVKAFIYNKLVIALDKGELYNGHELSKVSDIVDDYSSALEDYKTFLKEKMAKILFMNNSVSMSRYIQGMVSPFI